MHQERIKRYVARLCEVVDGATTGYRDPKPIPRPRIDGSRSYSLNDEIHQKQKDIISDLLKREGWSKKFSESHLDRQVSDIVSKNVGTADNSGVEPMFVSLVKDYETFARKMTVLIPLEGIVLRIAELNLGKIRLVSATPEYLEGLREEGRKITKETKADEATKVELLKELNDRIDEFKDSVCAERTILAESVRAKEIAREDLRLTVALLNFISEAVAPSFHNIRVGLRGEFSRGSRIELARDEGSMLWGSRMFGPRAPLFIDEKALGLMKDLDIFELTEFVTKDDFDADATFEGVILTAIHFHSHSRELADLTDKLLNLITAVESFFETSQKNIAHTVAIGCALVLCNSIDDRMRMKALMKEYYGLRSSISHHGKRSVLESDVNTLSTISWQLICFAIKNRKRFGDKAAFNSWIEKLELGMANEESILTFDKH